MKIVNKYYFKYILLISVLVVLFLLIYKKILMYLLFNDFFTKQDKSDFINKTYKINKFYINKYESFFNKYNYCNNNNFSEIPYLTKDELIEYNDDIITPPYKKCNLKCISSCINDPLWYDKNCSIGQSTGGTSGKSTFIWMNKYNAYIYIYTFMTSFKKNGYSYGDKIMVFYPSNSYFTNEYEKSNYYLLFMNVFFLSFNKIDREKTLEFVNSINTNTPDLLVIFPFVLLQLCININKYNIKITHYPKNINLSGEFLLNCSLNFCKKTFLYSNIENTYGAVEFGEIAHQVKDDKNTFEVFNQFCYLENKDDKIVVTSLINDTFPIIRYIMEDIGVIVNKNGKQYITNLIGKNTNQIIINENKFTSLDVDKLIDFVNISDNIISIVIEYDNHSIDINYIIYRVYNTEDQQIIINKTYYFMGNHFYRMKYNINFLEKYTHDYLKKFKIIVKKDNTDAEPVGGYFKIGV
jgi:phenylacetate-coenzyme A ligase PaaK-like adenylate-forming protein